MTWPVGRLGHRLGFHLAYEHMFDYARHMASFQGSLFDTATEPGLRPLAGALRRTSLSDGAWIDQLPEWVERADLLFESLVDDVAWRSEERVMYDRKVEVPRLVASYGGGVLAPHPALGDAMARLADHYQGTPGADLATIGLCLYRNGSDSVAWHGDTLGAEPPRTRWLPSCPWVAVGGWPSDRSKADRRLSDSSSVEVISWSWEGAASARGSTPCRRRPVPSVHG